MTILDLRILFRVIVPKKEFSGVQIYQWTIINADSLFTDGTKSVQVNENLYYNQVYCAYVFNKIFYNNYCN